MLLLRAAGEGGEEGAAPAAACMPIARRTLPIQPRAAGVSRGRVRPGRSSPGAVDRRRGQRPRRRVEQPRRRGRLDLAAVGSDDATESDPRLDGAPPPAEDGAARDAGPLPAAKGAAARPCRSSAAERVDSVRTMPLTPPPERDECADALERDERVRSSDFAGEARPCGGGGGGAAAESRGVCSPSSSSPARFQPAIHDWISVSRAAAEAATAAALAAWSGGWGLCLSWKGSDTGRIVSGPTGAVGVSPSASATASSSSRSAMGWIWSRPRALRSYG